MLRQILDKIGRGSAALGMAMMSSGARYIDALFVNADDERYVLLIAPGGDFLKAGYEE